MTPGLIMNLLSEFKMIFIKVTFSIISRYKIFINFDKYKYSFEYHRKYFNKNKNSKLKYLYYKETKFLSEEKICYKYMWHLFVCLKKGNISRHFFLYLYCPIY